MAHFLSDCSHDRLFHRQQPTTSLLGSSRGVSAAHTASEPQVSAVTGLPSFRAPSSAPTGAVTVPITGPGAGLFRSASFEGPIRSAAVAQTIKHGHSPVVWCGDTEGTFSLRNASTGEVTQILEQREKNVYAYAIVFVPNDEGGGDLWVGFSDGYLCVLDADSGAKKYETRAHGGAIYTMQYHAITHRVYSSGADWQITAWNAEKMCRAPAPSQMSGHQNGVRALCFGVAGNSMVLYSGADDMSIRAWDVTKHQQLTGGWPALGHRGGVHALACTGQLLFSSSTDGSVRVWSAAFGEPIGVVEQRQSPVNCLCFDEANNAVWAGGIDGIVHVWDATDLSLRAELTEHHTTHTPLAMGVARLAACKVWSLTKDGVVVHYIDTDGAVGGGDAIENTRLAEIECINDVDRRRRKVIECDIELNDLRVEGERMQERERLRKVATALAMHRGHNRQLQQQYLSQITTFVDKRRRLRLANANASALASRVNHTLARQYWAKWTKRAEDKGAERSRKAAAALIEGIHSDRLRAAHANVMLETARRMLNANQSKSAASMLATLNQHVLMHRWLRRWGVYAKAKIHARREHRGREQFAEAAAGYFDRAAGAWAFHRAEQACFGLTTAKAARAHASVLCAQRIQDLRRRYFALWLAASLRSVREMAELKTRNMQAEAARVHEECRERADAERRADLAALAKTKEKHDAHMKELAELRRNILLVEDVSEADLNAQIAERERQVALIQAETRKEQMVLEEINKEKRALQRELMRDASLDTSKPVVEQLSQAVYLLKARGVNVQRDQVAIAAAREAASKKTPTNNAADLTYRQGLATIREVFAEAIRPHNLQEHDAPLHWLVRGALDKMHDKQLTKAATGLATLVTAYDVLSVGVTGGAWVHPDPQRAVDAAAAKAKAEKERKMREAEAAAKRVRLGETAALSDEEKKRLEEEAVATRKREQAEIEAKYTVPTVFRPEFKHFEEVITNFGPLLDLAIRIYKWRRGELTVKEAPSAAASPPTSPTRAVKTSASPAGKTAPRAVSASPARASPGGKTAAPATSSTSPAAKRAASATPSKTAPKPAAKTSTTTATKAPAPAAKTAAPKPAAKVAKTATTTTTATAAPKPAAKTRYPGR